ncbi:hypothetical protein BJ322DRAFT_233171 [Thelephora terrestris]|uniref:Uncharacterized protein n=1 Tax=Thelephora terrestris TaxID=56493 RepID=A0A9P6H8L6_9AGAM|nr:hypothetical protein BJ322DRAFT_233171 [Thelephora terrestris]
MYGRVAESTTAGKREHHSKTFTSTITQSLPLTSISRLVPPPLDCRVSTTISQPSSVRFDPNPRVRTGATLWSTTATCEVRSQVSFGARFRVGWGIVPADSWSQRYTMKILRTKPVSRRLKVLTAVIILMVVLMLIMREDKHVAVACFSVLLMCLSKSKSLVQVPSGSEMPTPPRRPLWGKENFVGGLPTSAELRPRQITKIRTLAASFWSFSGSINSYFQSGGRRSDPCLEPQ